MFGRYPLPLWRRVVGLALVLLFVWALYGYMRTDHWGAPGSNSSFVGPDGSIPPGFAEPMAPRR